MHSRTRSGTRRGRPEKRTRSALQRFMSRAERMVEPLKSAEEVWRVRDWNLLVATGITSSSRWPVNGQLGNFRSLFTPLFRSLPT